MKAVITYYQTVGSGAVGNTIGADGSGDFAIIIEADDDVTLRNKTHEVADRLYNLNTIKNIVIVIENSAYYDTIREIKV